MSSGARALRVRYLLEGTGLFGGVKVVLEQARLLLDRGHAVDVVSREPAPDWGTVPGRFVQASDLIPHGLEPPDVVVATYWTTIAAALGSPGAAVHLCQGFEGHFTHNRHQHGDIERAYRTRLPALVVSDHLGELLRHRFGRPARRIPQPLEPFWRPARARPASASAPRILIVGPFEVDWKGVATGLRAVQRLRAAGVPCRLVRLSPSELGAVEKELCAPDEYHDHLRPEHAARLYRGCDLLLAPSWEQEGFGLPVLEAMASGVPVVASDISAFREFAGEAARLVPADDPLAFADAAREILGDRAARARRRRAGLAVARRFGGDHTADALEAGLRWVVDDEWRDELDVLPV